MNLYWINKLGKVISLVGAIELVNINFVEPTRGQIEPDTTLGLESSTVLINGDTANHSSGGLITGGARRGNNLFHSFKNFNINQGQIIYFDSSSGITRIFSRITGNNPSQILGTLGVWDNLNHQIGTADLFLINPNGILFGRDARLNLGGSFIASTASSIIFADDTEFSASNPSNSSLLTVSIPIGLQFRANVGAIRTQAYYNPKDPSSGLAVKGGRTLALVGGEITLDQEASIYSGSRQEAGGRIELGAVGADETVNLQAIATGWALNYENVRTFADIQLLPLALINANGRADFGSGEIQIQGKNIFLVEGAQVSNFNAGTQPGGKIVIRASETLTIEKRDPISQFQSNVGNVTESSGQAGDIEITAKNLRLFDGASITTQSISDFSGRGGNITIIVTESADLTDGALITASSFGEGNAGDITILAKDLKVLGGSQISASTGGRGRGGNITINAASMEILGFSSEISVSSQGGGNAGNLILISNVLTLDNQGKLTGSSQSGEGGNIILNVGDTLLLRNNSMIGVTAQGTGNGGNINIDTQFLLAFPNENSDIIANSLSGQGGAININAQGVFGLSVRDRLTTNNDITAFSQLNPALNGTVTLNLPDTDPNRGIVQLTETTVDPNTLISQNPCQKGTGSQFTNIGRGSLPPSVNEDLSTSTVQVGLVKPISTPSTQEQPPRQPNTVITEKPVIPAQGWVFNDKGEVVLTAYNPSVTQQERLPKELQNCPAPSIPQK